MTPDAIEGKERPWRRNTLVSSPRSTARRRRKRFEPNLVVCGERGLSNIKYVFVGSVSTFLIRNLRCDVLVVKQ